jgi:hypothetical protein
MKKLLLLTAMSFFALSLLLKAGISSIDKSTYIDQKVLDMASPLNVNIDAEFLNKLAPAYEQ